MQIYIICRLYMFVCELSTGQCLCVDCLLVKFQVSKGKPESVSMVPLMVGMKCKQYIM